MSSPQCSQVRPLSSAFKLVAEFIFFSCRLIFPFTVPVPVLYFWKKFIVCSFLSCCTVYRPWSVLQICNHWHTGPPRLHFEPPRLHFEPPRLHCEHLRQSMDPCWTRIVSSMWILTRLLTWCGFGSVSCFSLWCGSEPATQNDADPCGTWFGLQRCLKNSRKDRCPTKSKSSVLTVLPNTYHRVTVEDILTL
jgi:hypothetical protein